MWVSISYSWVEDIDGLDSCLASLLGAKHKIYPLVEILGHKVTLQSLYTYIDY